MTQEYKYVVWHASGLNDDTTVGIGYRYIDESAIRDDEVESWLLQTHQDGSFGAPRGWGTYINGVWRSASGRIFMSIADGSVLTATLSGNQFNELANVELDVALTGIWGLDDQHVYAYGGAPDRPGKIRFYDGATWTKLPDAPDWILHMHGCAPDCIYGVGQKTVFRWDGQRWHETNLRANVSLAAVWVENPDEIYATDVGGTLFDGSSSGFVERARWEGPLDGVAKFKGTVWLGGVETGLLKLDGKTNKIESVKPKILTRGIEARETLIIAAGNRFVFSTDGQSFYSVGADAFERIVKPLPFLG